MIVYRVQDKEGRGPYRPHTSDRWTDPLHHMRNSTFMAEFPWLRLGLKGKNDAFGCAFLTLEQLVHWFSPVEREKLQILGYRVVSMEVQSILAESVSQVVFWRNEPLDNNYVVIPWYQLPN